MSDLSATNCGCNNARSGCGFGGDSCVWIILLLLFCGGGCGCNGSGLLSGNNCGCNDNNGCSCIFLILILLFCGNGFGGCGCGC